MASMSMTFLLAIFELSRRCYHILLVRNNENRLAKNEQAAPALHYPLFRTIRRLTPQKAMHIVHIVHIVPAFQIAV